MARGCAEAPLGPARPRRPMPITAGGRAARGRRVRGASRARGQRRWISAEARSLTPDLWFEAYGLAVEYEGSQHQEDRGQYSADIDRYRLYRRNRIDYEQITKERMRSPKAADASRSTARWSIVGYDGPPPDFGDLGAALRPPRRRRTTSTSPPGDRRAGSVSLGRAACARGTFDVDASGAASEAWPPRAARRRAAPRGSPAMSAENPPPSSSLYAEAYPCRCCGDEVT